MTIKVCIISFSETAIRLTCQSSRGKYRPAWPLIILLFVFKSR